LENNRRNGYRCLDAVRQTNGWDQGAKKWVFVVRGVEESIDKARHRVFNSVMLNLNIESIYISTDVNVFLLKLNAFAFLNAKS
jgi:hypothetical protein